MAKYYFRLLLLVSAVIGFFALVGSLLPRGYSFSTDIKISASPEQVFQKLNSLEQWPEWSRQWNTEDIKSLRIQYGPVTEGEGAAQTWSDIRGEGKLWIVKSEPFERVEYDMTFGNFPLMKSQFEISSFESVTKVTWSSKGKLPGGPFYGYFGSFFSTQMKNEYDKSLEKLKQIIESGNAPLPGEASASDELESANPKD